MTITAAIVLFAVLWFFFLFIALPMKVKSQDEVGDVVPGTPASAPDEPLLKKKFFWVTVASVIAWAALCGVIMSGVLTVEMFDVFGRMKGT